MMYIKLPCEPGRKGACPEDSLASHTAFSVFICGGGKRVWSNDQGGLVSRMPRFSRRVNHSDHHVL